LHNTLDSPRKRAIIGVNKEIDVKPSEVYKWKPVETTRDLYHLEFAFENFPYDVDDEKNLRIEIRYYANHCFDGERTFSFFSVWLDDKPFMICECAGRGGTDCQEFFVTDRSLYNDAATYIQDIGNVETEPESQSPDEDIEELGEFYGYNVLKFYSPQSVRPKYKKWDVVTVSVREDPHSYTNKRRVDTPVRITQVFPHNPLETYYRIQLCRRQGSMGAGAQFNDADIKGFAEIQKKEEEEMSPISGDSQKSKKRRRNESQV